MRKMVARPDYQPRAFSGLLQHRYGEQLTNRDGTVRAVYVPGKSKPPRPTFNADKRKHIVAQTSEILKDFTATKFEHEGACRAGIRSGLCLDGYDWHISDAAAAGIVAEALDMIGARRPSHEEGQREYTDPIEQCSWCKGPIPDELFYRPNPSRYCSDVCAKSAVQQRDFADRHSSNRAYRDACDVIRAHKQPVRTCPCCTKKFRTHQKEQIYCSEVCANRHRPTVQSFANICLCCCKPFSSTYAEALYCSPTCRSKFAMLASGSWKPKRLSPPVFDFFITLPVNSRPPVVTPERFDQLLAMAG